MRVSIWLALAVVAAAIPPASAHQRRGGARAASTRTVRMGEFFYKPRTITVHVGDRARFVNVGRIEHTVADSTKRGRILSRVIKPRPLAHGQSQTVTFKRAGTVYYLCTFHPKLMRGRVVVRR
jgi:plastocyanin